MSFDHSLGTHNMESGERDGTAATLARAFYDDPVLGWLVGSRATRIGKMSLFFETMLQYVHIPHGCNHVGPNLEAAALWVPPGQQHVSLRAAMQAVLPMLQVFGFRAPIAARVLAAMEREHLRTRHYYLAVLGTDPSHQGQGWGGRVLAPVLRRCDAEGEVAYLESSNRKNVPFYQRHGFRVLKELSFGVTSPSVWLMQRDPSPRS